MQALDSKQVIAVIGAGTMGAGIAQVAAQRGHPVRIFDLAEGAAAKAIDSIGEQLAHRVSRGKISTEECAAVLARLSPAAELDAVAGSALVIEAIAERLDVKQSVFQRLEIICGPDCILATNTSSLSVTAIAAALGHPEQMVGMHFFNPAPVMQLVEVVSGLATSKDVAQRTYETAAAWGKKPVLARSTPGFIVNRVARPFYAEALRLLQEQVAEPATVDAVMREAGGFRMGPLELTDLIGQDVNAAVTRSMFEAYHYDPRYKPSLIQEELVSAQRLGRKNGRGFYDYGEDATRPEPETAASAPKPGQVLVRGALGPAAALLERLQGCVEMERTEGTGYIEVDGVRIALSDGRTATARATAEGVDDLVLFDLTLDYAAATRIALSAADQASDTACRAATGLFQAAGFAVSWVDDAPALVLLRTVAMLANEGFEATHHGVCSAAAVDEAMCYGTNYPRGPIAWAQQLGLAYILRVLENLQAAYGEDRYRPVLKLRRLSASTLRDTQSEAARV
ncbi:3-hydroxybutyryl-CoA dehydrogenase [Modicisalibacter muralis]|uniref:3-hydroxybutyryl-CoA dehydrogenase n=2 Tax=Modicisalibacter muralis TaxID=119000 RepID=A0A1G9LM41_9GAMM|nr:3-hydroxybutyryl-CoA dehydrogenase [Halomonas muralis]